MNLEVLMKKNVVFFASIVIFFTLSSVFISAESVKRFAFTAVTKTEKVVITIDTEKDSKTMNYFTPSKDYNYRFLDYDYSFDPNENTYILKGTVLDTLLSTATDVVIYSNGTFTDMRIGKRRVTFSYVEECTVEK